MVPNASEPRTIDALLAEYTQTGAAERLEELYARLAPALYGWASLRIRDELQIRIDPEDIVQETYVRWHTAQPGTVENAEAWLVTAATRLSIDRLRRLKTEREAYVGPWLPEPIVEETPERLLELSSDLSMAMLTMLETLAPDERADALPRSSARASRRAARSSTGQGGG